MILDEGECKEAVEDLGQIYRGNEIKSEYPSGCYSYNDRSGYFNKHESGTGNADVKSICKQDLAGDAKFCNVELIVAVNNYRSRNGLSVIPSDQVLCNVATWHAYDQNKNGKACDHLHSWSSNDVNGIGWKPCCYGENHENPECMWRKPREFSGDQSRGNGYEISAEGGNSADSFLQIWKESAGHNAVILNQGIWAPKKWTKIGAGISGKYAHVWFADD